MNLNTGSRLLKCRSQYLAFKKRFETARRVAASIAEIRQSYPNVKVVDYEAPTITSSQQWNADSADWLSAYRQATRMPLDAVVFDVDWRLPWLDWVSPSTAVAHKNNVRAGIFLDGTGPGNSDADAMAAYRKNALSVDRAKLGSRACAAGRAPRQYGLVGRAFSPKDFRERSGDSRT
jgi:hypothetical protein